MSKNFLARAQFFLCTPSKRTLVTPLGRNSSCRKFSLVQIFVIYIFMLQNKFSSSLFRSLVENWPRPSYQNSMERVEASVGELGRFTIEAMVRGYHTYRDIWEASVGEELPCQRETDNPHDRFAVAVLKDACVVGHLPRKISSVSSIFIRRGGSIHCRVTGSR